MRCAAVVLALLCGCSRVNPLLLYVDTQLPPVEDPSAYSRRAEFVPMRDGTKLATWIFANERGPSSPCVLVRMPLPEGMRYNLFLSTFGAVWSERGYSTIVQNVRGFPPSEGRFEPFVHERNDGLDTLQWLASSGVCNDIVNTWGGSYFGLTQWSIGDTISGAKAVQISSPRLRQTFFPGGAFALSTALYWIARNHDLSPSAEEIRDAAMAGPIAGAARRLTGENEPAFEAWRSSGNTEEYWRSQFPAGYESMRGPVLLMAGWFDPFLPAMLEDARTLRALGQHVKLVIGPWSHAQTMTLPSGVTPRNYRLESVERALAWFACAREDDCLDDRTEIFLLGDDHWKTLVLPNPESPHHERLTLDFGSGRMTTEAESFVSPGLERALVLDPNDPTPSLGGVDLGYDAGPLEQAPILARPDLVALYSPPRGEDLTVLGTPIVHGVVRRSECSADVAVTLVDRHPDGRVFLVSEGISRIPPQSSSSEVPVDVSLWPTAFFLRAGHQLGLVIAPAKFPKYDLPSCVEERGRAQLLLRGSWSLDLPVVEREAFLD